MPAVSEMPPEIGAVFGSIYDEIKREEAENTARIARERREQAARDHLAKFVLAITLPKLQRALRRLSETRPWSDRFMWTVSAPAFWIPVYEREQGLKPQIIFKLWKAA